MTKPKTERRLAELEYRASTRSQMNEPMVIVFTDDPRYYQEPKPTGLPDNIRVAEYGDVISERKEGEIGDEFKARVLEDAATQPKPVGMIFFGEKTRKEMSCGNYTPGIE